MYCTIYLKVKLRLKNLFEHDSFLFLGKFRRFFCQSFFLFALLSWGEGGVVFTVTLALDWWKENRERGIGGELAKIWLGKADFFGAVRSDSVSPFLRGVIWRNVQASFCKPKRCNCAQKMCWTVFWYVCKIISLFFEAHIYSISATGYFSWHARNLEKSDPPRTLFKLDWQNLSPAPAKPYFLETRWFFLGGRREEGFETSLSFRLPITLAAKFALCLAVVGEGGLIRAGKTFRLSNSDDIDIL